MKTDESRPGREWLVSWYDELYELLEYQIGIELHLTVSTEEDGG